MAASSCRSLAVAAWVLLSTGPLAAQAQDAPWTAQPTAADPNPATPAAKAARAPAGKAPGAEAGTAAPEGGEAKLRQRVEQLEEQIVDMQVVIGTLETLARGGGAARPADTSGVGAGSGSDSGDQARLDGIETQIRALTAQVEQLSNDVKGQPGLPKRSEADPLPPGGDTGAYSRAADGTSSSRFGSTTVTSGTTDPIGDMAASGTSGGMGAAGSPSTSSSPASSPLPPAGQVATATPDAAGGGNPKQLYEAAYGYLLQQDYSAAQAGFSDFLKRYPKDSLAPNALYWLGEAHYVQRNFADAAEAFDLVTSSFGSSNKAPDAMLKRGMALAQLGKRQDACTVLRNVGAKYPSAPPLVKSKAESERQRVGCP